MSISSVEKRLNDMGISLPPCPTPVAAYVPVQVSGKLLYASGQTPILDGKLQYVGKVGADVTLEDGYAAARLCAVRLISALASAHDLDKLRIVKVTGFVNCTPDYTDQPKVINGASELFEKAFLEKGKHARAAVGVGSLPGGVAAEVECIAEIVD